MRQLFTSILASLFLVGTIYAADLTVSQMQTLKTAALADPVAATLYNAGNDNGLAEWFNADNSKVVWRSTLTPDVMREAIVGGAAQLDNLTVGKRDALLYLVGADLRNTLTLRATLDDLCGTQATLKASIVAAQKRTATKAESILATGTGTTAVPATLTWEGQISASTNIPNIKSVQ
jgi:hypothetical protein